MNIDRIAPRKSRPSGRGMGDLYHWFQNRYKFIVCQEDVYLKELVRYIHLHPVKFPGGNPI